MDNIDHALGRPVDPLAETFRNHFYTGLGTPEADEFAASPCWRMGRRVGGSAYFHVTRHGREVLKAHLREIGDKSRLYEITWKGEALSPVVATNRREARYRKWLAVSDTCDVSFIEFAKAITVRLAS
nr:hypothetical protein [Vannielia litorea]